MATKRYYATGDFRYQTRMLRAGDPIELDSPSARLFKALDKITDKAPRAAKPQLDHDNDGKAGGSKAGAQSTRAKGRRRRKK